MPVQILALKIVLHTPNEIYLRHSLWKRRINAAAKINDQSACTSQKILPVVIFLHVKGSAKLMVQSGAV